MISYRSLIFLTTAMNDIYMYICMYMLVMRSTISDCIVVLLMNNKEQPPASLNEEEDPGVLFVLWPSSTGATSIHQCLALPSVATLDPPLEQGR